LVLLGRAGGVGANQYRRPAVLVGGPQLGRDLGERGVEHRHVIDRGVGAGFPWAEPLGQRLPATAGAVIGEREQRVEPEGAFPGAGGIFLVGVRGDQAGVHVDHHPTVLHRRPGMLPDPFPRRRSSRADRGQHLIGVGGQGRDQP